MYNSGILDTIVIVLAIIGFTKLFIKSIGDPLDDFDHNSILSRYVSLIRFIFSFKWERPLTAWLNMYDNLGYKKMFFCSLCQSFWIFTTITLYNSTNITDTLIKLGIGYFFITILNK